MDKTIQVAIEEFKNNLANQSLTKIVRKHITFGTSHILDQEKHFNLKAEVAEL